MLFSSLTTSMEEDTGASDLVSEVRIERHSPFKNDGNPRRLPALVREVAVPMP